MLPAAAIVPLASFFTDPGEALGEIGFVIRLMSFVYILFWLYATFQENQLLFGFTALIAAYFVIFYAPVVVVLAAVVLIMVNGMFLQQALMFGLFPAMGRNQMGMPVDYAHEEEAMQAQNLQSRLQAGQQLSEQEMQFLAQVQQRQEIAQSQIQQVMGSGDHGDAHSFFGGVQGAQQAAFMNQVGMRRR